MTDNQKLLSVTQLENLQSSGAGYDVLRYITIPEMLGSEKDTLLYFMGKSLARKLKIESLNDIYYLFDKLGWGRLELVKQNKKMLIFNLMADTVARRIHAPFPAEFRIEAGLLAEAIQHINGVPCECTEEINEKILQVELRVIFTE